MLKAKKDKTPQRTKKFSLDGLNQTQVITLDLNGMPRTLYVSVYKGAESKVIEFSDEPCKHIAEKPPAIEDAQAEEHDEDDFIMVTKG